MQKVPELQWLPFFAAPGNADYTPPQLRNIRGRMRMKLDGSYRFAESREQVWATLMDPDAIAGAIPGVQEFVPLEGEEYAWRAIVKVNMAAVSGRFSGQVHMSEIQPPVSYRLTVSGEGQGSIISGSVLMQLRDGDGGDTELKWEAEANISGKLARIGQRLIKAAANMMSKRFFGNLARRIRTAA